MEAFILLSIYDHRWFFMGLPKSMGFYDIHQDITLSNLCFGMAYIKV